MARHWFTTYLTDHYSKNKKFGLDIGCKTRPYQDVFNCKYVGLDLPSEIFKNGVKKPDIFGTGEFLPFSNNTFDFITCFSVIPYVEHIDRFLNEMFRIIKPSGTVVITIMNLKALARDPKGYYPNKFSSRQLHKKLGEHGFESIKTKNPKALVWSTYFDLTSVYSYAIIKPNKKLNSSIQSEIITKSAATKKQITRQSIRSKLIKNPKLYSISKNLYRNYCSATHWLHTYPDFLIIGAAKCGTSSLYDHLMQHPCIGQSLAKQIHFFDRYFDRKTSWYKVCFPFIWEKFYVEKLLKKKFATGEATAHYMTHPLAAKRAFEIVPNAKIIVMLRNPVDRAYSHYNMEKANYNEELSFEEVIEQENTRIAGEFEKMLKNENNSGVNYPHRAYIKSGEYLDQIKRWMEYYPKGQFLFIKTEEFNKDPSGIYHQVLKFLGLPPHELPVYEKIRKRKYEKMNSETRKKLLEYFKPFNEKLYEYLEKNFHWDI